jgi:Fur family ferric uptake transcriptional regulator
MSTAEVEEILIGKNVNPTSNRILVYKAFAETNNAVSLGDLEEMLSTMDKSSIFRVINLFAEHDILHIIDDGTRSVKYELCHSPYECTHDDCHVHFHCEICDRTFCLEDIHVPEVALPEGFALHSVNYILKGKCPKCSAKRL